VKVSTEKIRWSRVPAGAALALLLAIGAGGAAVAPPDQPDARAAAVADAVMKAGGGDAGGAASKYLRFTFAVEKDGAIRSSRTHYWDRVTNRHHLEWTTKDGKSLVCVEYLDTREGVCTAGDQPLFDADAKPYLESAYEMWINDTYWLLMPYKMKDPGVHLKYDGEAKESGKVYDKVLLTFDDVGITPRDRYWAYVDRQTHRMDKWAFVLQNEKGEPGTDPPSVWTWSGWSKFGGMMLSTVKTNEDGKTKILFKNLAAFDTLPDEVFTKTAKVDPALKP
jgi:hypothetical protein